MTPTEAKFYAAASDTPMPPVPAKPMSWFSIGLNFGFGFFLAAFLFSLLMGFLWVIFIGALMSRAVSNHASASPIPSIVPAATKTLYTSPIPVFTPPSKSRSPFFRRSGETDAQFSERMTLLTQPPLNHGQWTQAEHAEALRQHKELIKAEQDKYQEELENERQ